MNPEIKKRWLEALPKYQKGKMYLKSGDRFCALGVLCDLYSKEFGCPWEKTVESRRGVKVNTFMGWESVITGPLIKWAGFSGNFSQSDITSLNDNSDTFEPVIKYIEENL